MNRIFFGDTVYAAATLAGGVGTANAQEYSTQRLEGIPRGAIATIGDVDSDGRPDAVYAHQGRIYVISNAFPKDGEARGSPVEMGTYKGRATGIQAVQADDDRPLEVVVSTTRGTFLTDVKLSPLRQLRRQR